MRRIAAVAAVVTLLVALVGVAHLLRDSSSSPVTPPPGTDPAALVGSWQVNGDAAIDGREVRLHAAGRVSMRDGACVLMGRWAATTSGLITMNVDTATSGCRDLDAAFEYFRGVQRYELMPDAVRLDDLEGSTVAVLSDRAPLPDPDQTPVPRAAPAELPSGVVPPSLQVLTGGRWLPADTVGSDRWSQRDRPHALFDTTGRWHGSDGCNGLGGPWTMDLGSGEWLAGTLGQTEIGCDNVDVSSTVSSARAVGLDGDELVFYDADGTETGRFAPEGGQG